MIDEASETYMRAAICVKFNVETALNFGIRGYG
jgi:hypothetical protein